MNLPFYLRPLFILALSSAILFSGLGAYPLTDRDEGEYAASASEMIKSGDYVVPTLNGRPYLEKPILFFWLLSASFKIFGQSELSARLTSALSAMVLISSLFFLYYFLNERVVSNKRGLFARSALLLLSFPLFLLVARACLTDMLLTLFIWLSMMFFFLFIEKGHVRWFILLSWLFLALGFLTKGPVAVAICIPVFFIYSLLLRDFHWLRPVNLFTGVAIFLLINLPWYLAIYNRMGKSFIETFFVTQNLERFSRTLLGHGGGPLFYVAVLGVGMFPFSILIPKAIKRDFLIFRKAFHNKDIQPCDRLRLFCFTATVWTFLILTLSATKQINYIVPLLPFLSISISSLLSGTDEWSSLFSRSLFFILLTPFMVFSLVMSLGLDLLWPHLLALVRFDSTEYAFALVPPTEIFPWGLGFFLVTAFTAYIFLGKKNEEFSRLSAGIMLAGFLVVLFLPAICRVIQLPAKSMALEVRNALNKVETNDGVLLTSFGLWKPSMIFYAGHPIKRIKTRHPERLAKVLSARKPCLVFTRARLEDELKDISGFFPVRQKAGYLLGGNREGYLLMKKDRN